MLHLLSPSSISTEYPKKVTSNFYFGKHVKIPRDKGICRIPCLWNSSYFQTFKLLCKYK